MLRFNEDCDDFQCLDRGGLITSCTDDGDVMVLFDGFLNPFHVNPATLSMEVILFAINLIN